MNELNEKISFNMGVKSAPFHMGRTFEMRCIKMDAKVPRLNQNNVKINQIDMRYRGIDDVYRLIIPS